MFRLFVLSLICWAVLGAAHLEASLRFTRVVSKNGECARALTEFKGFTDLDNGFVSFDIVGFVDFHSVVGLADDFDEGAEAFILFWESNPINQGVLKAFSDKVRMIRDNNNRLNEYEENLIGAIFLFMSSMAASIEHGEVKDDVLPSYIQNVINSFDQLSPVQMFIHTHTITEASKSIDYSGKFNFREPLESVNSTFLDTLSKVLKSSEQKSYVFQKYHQSLDLGQVVESTSQDQNNYGDEQGMIRQGHDPALVVGLDRVNSDLQLARLLRTDRVDIVSTYFTDRIDEHIAFIKKGIIESQEISESNRKRRLELLEAVELRAQSYKESGDLTYLYLRWLTVHLHLSIVASFDDSLLDDPNLMLFILRKPDDNQIDFDFLKEWMINDDGSDLLRLTSVFNLFHEFSLYRDHTHTTDNSDKINDMARSLGLDMTVDDIQSLNAELENDILLMNELARRANLDLALDPRDFDAIAGGEDFVDINSIALRYHDPGNFLFAFIYLLRQFPERLAFPTIHKLGTISFNKAHRNELHFISLANHSIVTSRETISPFKSFLYGIRDSSIVDTFHIDNDPQVLIRFQQALEKLPIWERELIENWYSVEGASSARNFSEEKGKQRQILFELIAKESLTAEEESKLQTTILMLMYLEFMSEMYRHDQELYEEYEALGTSAMREGYYAVSRLVNYLEEYEDAYLTEENIRDNLFIFGKFVSRLLSL